MEVFRVIFFWYLLIVCNDLFIQETSVVPAYDKVKGFVFAYYVIMWSVSVQK